MSIGTKQRAIGIFRHTRKMLLYFDMLRTPQRARKYQYATENHSTGIMRRRCVLRVRFLSPSSDTDTQLPLVARRCPRRHLTHSAWKPEDDACSIQSNLRFVDGPKGVVFVFCSAWQRSHRPVRFERAGARRHSWSDVVGRHALFSLIGSSFFVLL